MSAAVRAKVVCVLWHSGRLLLIRASDPVDGRAFLIPPGGGVEFGETLDDAVRREIREELGTRLSNPRRVGMLESFFRFAGEDEHELIFVYEEDCEDPALVGRDTVELTESNGEKFLAHWYTPAEMAATGLVVVPDGLPGLLGLDTTAGRGGS